MRSLMTLILFLSCQVAFAKQACFIITDFKTGEVLVDEGSCEARRSPASTFKIALSLMGFDSGIFASPSSPAWPYKEEYNATIKTHRQTLTPASWMEYSGVWYSQQLTNTMGMEKFQAYVDAFNYGNKDLSGTPGADNGLTHAWLGNSLQISPQEQIEFITKVLKKAFSVSDAAYKYTEEILFSEQLPNGWKIYGKTGTVIRSGKQEAGWYVGWASKSDDTLVFAYLIEPDEDKVIKNPVRYAGSQARAAFIDKFTSFLVH